MERYFSQEKSPAKTLDLQTYLNSISKIMDYHQSENEPLSNYSDGDAGVIIHNLEKAALLLRRSSEDKEREHFDFQDTKIDKECVKDMPVKMTFDGTVFSIKTPYTIKRQDSKSKKYQQENYTFLGYVNAEIMRWVDEHPDEKLKFNSNFLQGNLHLIVIRYATKFNHSLHCDHDNLENSRIQNSICSALGVTDRADVMQYHSIFKICDSIDDEGMEFVITNGDKAVEILFG